MKSQTTGSKAVPAPQLAGAQAVGRPETGRGQLLPPFRAGEPMADSRDGSAAGQSERGVNIVNHHDVDKLVEGFAGHVRRPEGQQWCRRNLRKYLLREARLARSIGETEIAGLLSKEGKGEPPGWVREAVKCGRALHWFTPEVESWDGQTDFIQALHCVVAWIEALPEADRHWRQFYKIGVPEAIAAARAWRRTLARQSEKYWPEDWTGIRTVMRFENGLKFVNLTSAAALEREGHLMWHCVAAYGDDVQRGSSQIYSLRDTDNRPHVTMEVRQNWVAQAKGKKNSIPSQRWRPYVNALISVMGWDRWTPGLRTEGFVFRGRTYGNVAEVIAELPELIDLDAAVFDYRLLIPVFRFIGRIVQHGADVFTAEHERTVVAMLRERIAAHRGYRIRPAAAVVLELPRSSIIEMRVELAGAAFALAEMGFLSEAGEEIAELCRQVGLNVLALI
jgi:PcfJ-like protein